jgi:hypothetical protein
MLSCVEVLVLLLLAYIISLIAAPIILIRIQRRLFGESQLAWLPGLGLLIGIVVLRSLSGATGSSGKSGDVPIIDFSGLGYFAGCFLLFICGVACLVAAAGRHKQSQPPDPVLPTGKVVNRYPIVEFPPQTPVDDAPYP